MNGFTLNRTFQEVQVQSPFTKSIRKLCSKWNTVALFFNSFSQRRDPDKEEGGIETVQNASYFTVKEDTRDTTM